MARVQDGRIVMSIIDGGATVESDQRSELFRKKFEAYATALQLPDFQSRFPTATGGATIEVIARGEPTPEMRCGSELRLKFEDGSQMIVPIVFCKRDPSIP